MKDLDEQKIIEEKFNKNTYKPDAESKKAVMICFYFLSSLIVVFAVLSIWILSLLAKAYEFSETNGKVIAAQIVKTKGNKGKPLFNPKITYEYYINNKTYTASRFDILDFDKGLNLSKQIINDYPVGKEIKVYFNLSS